MPTGPTEVDPSVLRALLRRLSELEGEAHGVTDAVLGHLPYAGPGIADATVREVGADLVDAFSRLADSVAVTRRSLRDTEQQYVDVDLTVARTIDLTVVRDLDSAAR
jgi:hypothetical protein